MFKRTFLATAVGAAMVLGSMGSANAIEITAGNYKFIFDNYDVGTTGYGDTAGVKCTTVAACNAAATNQAQGTLSDTAGILSVASISNIATGIDEYTRGTASTLNGISVGPYLTGVFSGLNDFFVEVQTSVMTGASTTALATGGIFSIFSNDANYDPTHGPTGAGVDLDGMQYAGVSGGALFLSGVFASGGVLAGSDASYVTTYKNSTVGGNGQGFLDFTGGLAQSYFDNNALTNVNGGKNDAFLTVTYDNVNNVASDLGWDVKSSGQISGELTNDVPEPGSIALMSLAMLGLGAVTRRRNKQNGSAEG